MKTAKTASRILGLLGILLMIAAILLSFSAQDAPARLLWVSRDGQRRTQAYMDAMSQMDLQTLSDLTAGNPEYTAEAEPDSELADYLWKAYTQSISYEFYGDCYGTASGISRDVKVTVLDISGVLQKLKDRSYDLLAQQAAETDADLVFEENGQYREEFAMGVLRDGVEAILEEGSITKSMDLTLELTCRDGRWYVLPSQAVTNILTGSIGK